MHGDLGFHDVADPRPIHFIVMTVGVRALVEWKF